MNGIGQRIKQLLKSRAQSQKALSQATGIPQSTLSDIIKEKKQPSIDKVQLIADFLQVDLHWLIAGRPFTPPPSASAGVAESEGRRAYQAEETRSGYPRDVEAIIAILISLDAEARRLIKEMAERLQHKT